MDASLERRLVEEFDARPAQVDEYRSILRALVSHLTLDPLEAEIMAWDAAGRDPRDFERLRRAAWDFHETGSLAFRKRLFAGFVTNLDQTDGYGAEYLIEFAVGAGIAPGDIANAMTVVRSAAT